MKRFKCLLLIAVFLISALFVFSGIYYPKIRKYDDFSGFSAHRVHEYLENISKEPHSVIRPEERAAVRDYLCGRLKRLGGEPVVIKYDSVHDKIAGITDLYNIYTKFEPACGDASSYVLLIAHYDSRYWQDVKGDTVYSFGAADDGYGLGVSLELADLALDYRDEWKQGLKILFTDAEESNLGGMRLAVMRNPEIFENTGLVFNIEARGAKGPALLFETSPGNSKLMKYYKEHARYPYSYSLTSFVYKAMPNYTDFMLVKDSLPGYNFAVIDNLDIYHTDKDNMDNVSLRSLQHYGAQIEPMVKEYLTNGAYSDPDYFKSGKDSVFYTIPVLGMPLVSSVGWAVVNVFSALLFVFAYMLYAGEWKLRAGRILLSGLKDLTFLLLSAAACFAVSYIAACFSGVEFKITDTRYVTWSGAVFVCALLLFTACYAWMSGRRRTDGNHVFGTIGLALILSYAMYMVAGGDNFFILLPALSFLIALTADRFLKSTAWYYMSLFLAALVSISFYYIAYMALTIGSMSIIAFFALLDMALLYSMCALIFCFRR